MFCWLVVVVVVSECNALVLVLLLLVLVSSVASEFLFITNSIMSLCPSTLFFSSAQCAACLPARPLAYRCFLLGSVTTTTTTSSRSLRLITQEEEEAGKRKGVQAASQLNSSQVDRDKHVSLFSFPLLYPLLSSPPASLISAFPLFRSPPCISLTVERVNFFH